MEQMQQLVISGKDARTLYPSASPEWKTALETSFGKDFFSQKPTDRIKTFADACEVLGIDPGTVWHNVDKPDEIAFKKLKVVVAALNYLANDCKVWLPDYNNSREAKWYPWFYLNSPGFRRYVVLCVYAYSPVGARLVFKTEEIARYAASQFLGLYSTLLEMQPEAVSNGVAAPVKQITDFREIKTFEDACKVKGYDPRKILPDVATYPEPHRAALTGMAKLFVINEAINYLDNGNQNWVPDYDDGDEEKHYPWVDMEVDSNNPSGFQLDDVGYGRTDSHVGARLSYKSEDGARHAFTQFEGIYKDVFKLK